MSFGTDVAKFVAKTKGDGEKVQRALALQVFRGVIQRTPVDTGRARGSWNLDINRVNKGTGIAKGSPIDPPGTEGSPPSATQVASATLKALQAKWGDEVYISNNLPYIKKLEDGYSKQAPGPGAMVRSTVQEASDYLDDITRRL